MKHWQRWLKLLLLISILPLGYLLNCYRPAPRPNTLERHLSEFKTPPNTIRMPPGERWLFWGDDRYNGVFLAYKWMGHDWEVMGFVPYVKRRDAEDSKKMYMELLGIEEESPWD